MQFNASDGRGRSKQDGEATAEDEPYLLSNLPVLKCCFLFKLLTAFPLRVLKHLTHKTTNCMHFTCNYVYKVYKPNLLCGASKGRLKNKDMGPMLSKQKQKGRLF